MRMRTTTVEELPPDESDPARENPRRSRDPHTERHDDERRDANQSPRRHGVHHVRDDRVSHVRDDRRRPYVTSAAMSGWAPGQS